MHRSLLSAVLSLSVLLSTVVAAQDAEYTFTTVDVPGAVTTEARGINDTGQIVGWFIDGTVVHHGFVATPDTVPPVITVSASPATLWPPNGQLVTVTVSGIITNGDGGSGVKAGSAAYVVMDEYGKIQPSGNFTRGAGGSYAFTMALEASRRGNDQDGRQYTIAVSAKDNLGNPGFKPIIVTVPHR